MHVKPPNPKLNQHCHRPSPSNSSVVIVTLSPFPLLYMMLVLLLVMLVMVAIFKVTSFLPFFLSVSLWFCEIDFRFQMFYFLIHILKPIC